MYGQARQSMLRRESRGLILTMIYTYLLLDRLRRVFGAWLVFVSV